MAVGHEVELACVEVAGVVGALGQPATGTSAIRGHLVPVDDQIGPGSVEPDLDVVQDHVAVTGQEEVQFLVVGGAAGRIQLAIHVRVPV